MPKPGRIPMGGPDEISEFFQIDQGVSGKSERF
jgi:hypothetical protein